jgi:DnaK suppressor protein
MISKKFTKKRLKEFQSMFESKIDQIVKSINNADIQIDVDGDEIDIIQGKALNDIRETLSIRDLDTLNKLKAAIDKIEKGTFGICEECDEPIGERRLEVILGCNTCIDCAQKLEEMKRKG